jgi:hypothetical protein
MGYQIGSALDLLAICAAARHAGQEFPTIWINILKGHPLVAGEPVQQMDSNEPYTAIPLLTGQKLIFNLLGFSLR